MTHSSNTNLLSQVPCDVSGLILVWANFAGDIDRIIVSQDPLCILFCS